jgi:hypothetical protein
MTDFGGWFMYLAMKQQESERDADWRELDAEMAAEDRRYQDELAADERHQEMLEAMWATALKPPEPEQAPAAAYLGPRIDVAGVGLRDLSASPLPASAEALREEIQPLNLAVGGGTEDAGWAVGQAVQGLLGGRLVGLRLGGLRTSDLAAALTALQENDTLVIPTIEDASGEAVQALRGVLGSGFRDWQVSNDPAEEERLVATGLSPEEASARVGAHREMDPGRRLSVTIGKGESARNLTLALKPFAIVAHTASGRIPAPLDGWGGRLRLPKDTKTCPDCAEEVKAAARICRFCRYEFDKPEENPLWDDLPSR